jgi:hypothetical protein
MLVNAVYFLTDLEVPAKADVQYIDPFYPSFYGFIKDKEFWPGQDMQPQDYGLGMSPHAPDPQGTPKWSFRPSPKE